jgi:hypothetical protein
MMMATTIQHDLPFDRIFRWKNNPVRAQLYGRRCRILAVGSSKLAVLVEFEDGTRHVTSRRALKRVAQ